MFGHVCSLGKARRIWEFWKMAHPGRFELPTPWFVVKYSIQLSYGCALGVPNKVTAAVDALPNRLPSDLQVNSTANFEISQLNHRYGFCCLPQYSKSGELLCKTTVNRRFFYPQVELPVYALLANRLKDLPSLNRRISTFFELDLSVIL